MTAHHTKTTELVGSRKPTSHGLFFLCVLMGALSLSATTLVAQSCVVVRAVAPQYPLTAVQKGQAGDVLVQVETRPDGSVLRARARGRSPFRLRQAAVDAAMQWRFAPATAPRKQLLTFRFLIQAERVPPYWPPFTMVTLGPPNLVKRGLSPAGSGPGTAQHASPAAPCGFAAMDGPDGVGLLLIAPGERLRALVRCVVAADGTVQSARTLSLLRFSPGEPGPVVVPIEHFGPTIAEPALRWRAAPTTNARSVDVHFVWEGLTAVDHPKWTLHFDPAGTTTLRARAHSINSIN